MKSTWKHWGGEKKVDNNYYDEEMVINESDDNLAESKELKGNLAKF